MAEGIVIRKLLTYISISFLSGCISAVDDYKPDETTRLLVVEGFIDNGFGPHEIQISYLANFTGVLNGGGVQRIDARVSIIDEFGNKTELTRESGSIRSLSAEVAVQSCVPVFRSREFQSNYFTPATFKGEPGIAYALEIIEDQTGKKYRSLFSKIPQPVPLDSILFEFNKFPSENDAITGVDVYVEWEDPGQSDNYYWWEMEGTYKLETYQKSGQTCCVYDQSDQFGTRCWKVEKAINGSLGVISDKLFNGKSIIRNVGFIEDNGFRFSSNEVPVEKQYHLELSQYSIDKKAYEYLLNVGILSEIDGEIFDPPPTKLVGNVFNLEDPNEVVVGYFGVYSKATSSKFLNRNILPERKHHGLCGDCRYFKFQGQIETPSVYK